MLRVYEGDGLLDDEDESKKRGLRIAWIKRKGDEEPEKTVYLKGVEFAEDDPDADEDEDEEQAGRGEIGLESVSKHRSSLLRPLFFSSLRNVNEYNMALLKKAIDETNPSLLGASRNERSLREMYTQAEGLMEKEKGKHLILDRPKSLEEAEDFEDLDLDDLEVFVPIVPDKTFRTAFFGQTGTGKSYMAATTFMKSYEQFHPENKIFIFSFFEEDRAFRKLNNVEFVKIDEELVAKNDLHPRNFEDSLIVFDDIESLPVELHPFITHFRDQCLACGRKHGVSTIVIAHEIMGGIRTRSAVSECDEIVLFNQGNVLPIRELLSKKFGFDRKTISFVLNRKTRWVLVRRSYPQLIMSGREILVI